MILFAASSWPMAFFLAVLGLTIGIILMRTHRQLSRQRRDDSPILDLRQPDAPTPRIADKPPEFARWEVQLHETARDLSAEINSRVSVLRAMVAEADRAAARLEAAVKQAESRLPEEPPDRIVEQPAEDVLPQTLDESHNDAVYTLSDYGYQSGEIAARMGRPVGEIDLILGLRSR